MIIWQKKTFQREFKTVVKSQVSSEFHRSLNENCVELEVELGLRECLPKKR